MGSNVKQQIEAQLKQRILLIDGGMGTMIQGYKLEEQDYRGERFADWHSGPQGQQRPLLVLTQPQLDQGYSFSSYLEAGADILETNTFNATTIAMADYEMESVECRDQPRSSQACPSSGRRMDGERHRTSRVIVAGVLGPTNRTCSISPDVNDPGYPQCYL